MTLKELKEKIAESADYERLQNYSLTLKYPATNINLSIKGVAAIYEFILRQIEGLSSFPKLPQELVNVKKLFNDARDAIINLVNTKNANVHTWDNNLTMLTAGNRPIFLYDSPETEFLVRIFNEKQTYYEGAYEYLIGSTNYPSNKNKLVGYLLAYEFTSKDFSTIVERKSAEEKSILNIRSDFQKELAEAENQVTEYLNAANKKFVEYSGKIDQLKAEKESDFTNWFGKATSDFAQFNADSNKKIKYLENLYREKLKLEAPAKYWRMRAKKLTKQGMFWLSGLIATITIALNILLVILTDISIGTLEQIFQNTGTAIKWSVVVITVISFLAYAIRTFAKLTFSSFHLARDAEEREQLTYVYLALQEKMSIDPTERHLIMQSLFSRADSGLLKDDAGPTMPGQIIDQVAKR